MRSFKKLFALSVLLVTTFESIDSFGAGPDEEPTRKRGRSDSSVDEDSAGGFREEVRRPVKRATVEDLLTAIATERLADAERMIRVGAEVNTINDRLETPLSVAVKKMANNSSEIVISGIGDLEAERQERAEKYQKFKEIALQLKAAGAKVDCLDEDGDTLLTYVGYTGKWKMVPFLVNELGCDVNAQGDGDESILMLATSAGNTNLVKLLLESGAKKELINEAGKTAKEQAEDNGLNDILETLNNFNISTKK